MDFRNQKKSIILDVYFSCHYSTDLKRFLFVILLNTLTTLSLSAQHEKIDQLIQKGIEVRYQSVDSAHYFINLAEKTAQESGVFDQYEAKILVHRAGTNYVAGRYVASLEDYKKAYTLLENTLDEHSDLIRAINGLGLIELAQHNYPKAVSYWEKCLALSQEIQDSTSITRSHFNLGLGLAELKKFPEAIHQLEQAITIAILRKDKTHQLLATNRLAYIYYQLDQLDQATAYYLSILNLGKHANTWELAFANTGMAEVLVKQEQWLKALPFGENGYKNAIEIGAFWDKQRASAILTEIHENLGQYPQALAFSKINKQIGDSLYNKEKATEINFLKLQLANSENLKLSQEKASIQEQNKLYSIITAILITFIFFLGLGTWIIIKNSRQKSVLNTNLTEANQQLETQKQQIETHNNALNEINQAKNKLFSILSHDLRAPLNAIKQYMELERNNLFTEDEHLKLKALMYEQVHQTDILLNNLLNWSKTQLEGIYAEPSIVTLQAEMDLIIRQFDFQIESKKIHIQHQKQDIPLIWVDLNQLRIILQNILHNAIKFTPTEGEIKIFYSTKDSSSRIHIYDSGIGMSEEKRILLESNLTTSQSTPGTSNEAGTGVGLFLVKQLIHINEASLHIYSTVGKGTEFILSFPQVNGNTKDQSNASEKPALQSFQV